MTATNLPRTGGIEAELEQVYRDREQLLRATPSPARSQLIADAFDHEAWLWSVLFERTRSPLTWRAALAAEAYARGSARWWRRDADGRGVGLVGGRVDGALRAGVLIAERT
jgi:hypothetical protein